MIKKLVLYRLPVDFAFGWFSLFVVLQIAFWFCFLYFPLNWLWPGTWERQLASPFYVTVGCFVGFHLVVSFFEFVFHRYILHSVFWKLLQGLARKHREHHRLTEVREVRAQLLPNGTAPVRNRYPIVDESQIESSTFPGWALVSFWGIFTPLILVLQAVFPSLPVVIAGYLAVAWSFYLYEVKHAVEHLDYDKFWKRFVARPDWVGRTARKIYGFHLMHHSRFRVNQAISGFFGIPVPDLVFGTYFIPEQLPLPGALVAPDSQDPPPPCRFIQWLDRRVEQCEQRIRETRKQHARDTLGL